MVIFAESPDSLKFFQNQNSDCQDTHACTVPSVPNPRPETRDSERIRSTYSQLPKQKSKLLRIVRRSIFGEPEPADCEKVVAEHVSHRLNLSRVEIGSIAGAGKRRSSGTVPFAPSLPGARRSMCRGPFSPTVVQKSSLVMRENWNQRSSRWQTHEVWRRNWPSIIWKSSCGR